MDTAKLIENLETMIYQRSPWATVVNVPVEVLDLVLAHLRFIQQLRKDHEIVDVGGTLFDMDRVADKLIAKYHQQQQELRS